MAFTLRSVARVSRLCGARLPPAGKRRCIGAGEL